MVKSCNLTNKILDIFEKDVVPDSETQTYNYWVYAFAVYRLYVATNKETFTEKQVAKEIEEIVCMFPTGTDFESDIRLFDFMELFSDGCNGPRWSDNHPDPLINVHEYKSSTGATKERILN